MAYTSRTKLMYDIFGNSICQMACRKMQAVLTGINLYRDCYRSLSFGVDFKHENVIRNRKSTTSKYERKDSTKIQFRGQMAGQKK